MMTEMSVLWILWSKRGEKYGQVCCCVVCLLKTQHATHKINILLSPKAPFQSPFSTGVSLEYVLSCRHTLSRLYCKRKAFFVVRIFLWRRIRGTKCPRRTSQEALLFFERLLVVKTDSKKYSWDVFSKSCRLCRETCFKLSCVSILTLQTWQWDPSCSSLSVEATDLHTNDSWSQHTLSPKELQSNCSQEPEVAF